MFTGGLNSALNNVVGAIAQPIAAITDAFTKEGVVRNEMGVILNKEGNAIKYTAEQVKQLGLDSSKVGEEITLVYSKSGRFATIYIAPRGTVTGFIVGDYGSDIDISVVHPEAIDIQNPYEDLNYENLPESP